ncbi:MAG TPA: acyltransferase [Devosia sp.]|nr:acyltransferase [Devosia sp.]
MSSTTIAKPAPNRRLSEASALQPMRVVDAIIETCRQVVESPFKRRVRSAILPTMQRYLGLASVGEGFQWGLPADMRGLTVGRYVFVGAGCRLAGPLVIGDLTMISTGVTLVGDDHIYDDPAIPMRYNFPVTKRPATVIEADCWIGHGAIIKEGITIARGSIVAAGAVVTKSTLPYSVTAGVPGKALRSRFDSAAQRQHDILLYGLPFAEAPQ